MWRKITGSKEWRSKDLSFISSADAPAVSPTQKACNAVALQHPLLTTHSISSFWRLEENLNRVRIELTSHYLFLLSGALYIANVNSSFPNRRPLDQENRTWGRKLSLPIFNSSYEPIRISRMWPRANHRARGWRVRQTWEAGGFCGDKRMNALK